MFPLCLTCTLVWYLCVYPLTHNWDLENITEELLYKADHLKNPDLFLHVHLQV